MGTLYDIATRLTKELEHRHAGDAIALVRAKGTVAARTGFLVSLITPADPDDPVKTAAIRSAAEQLGIAL